MNQGNIMTNIKDMVRGDKHVNFVRYRDGDLWYATEDGFEFPVHDRRHRQRHVPRSRQGGS